MNNILRYLFILAYFSCHLTACLADQSTRERIALHKAWLEQRATRKRLYMQQVAKNITHPSEKHWWLYGSSYRRNHSNDLNEQNDIKPKPMKSSLFTSEPRQHHKKEKQLSQNDVLTNDLMEKSTTTTVPPLLTTAVVHLSNRITVLEKNSFSEPISVTTESNQISSTTPALPSTTATTTEHSIVYNVTQMRPQNSRRLAHRLRTKHYRNSTLTNAMWGRWQKWTKCSRSCGGGVMSQSRHCLSRDTSLTNRTSNECIGLHKRYRICNEQSCPDSDNDFREQQCIYYNNQTFHGQTYSWESYTIDESECELNCKPVGLNYFATLNDRVADGTSCSFPVDFVNRNHSGRAVCVEGVCKAIHSNGIITGAFMNNGAVRCGTTVCNPVSKTFTETPISIGYANLATIPAGASNISILELKNSENYLVLKRADHSFILNGDNIISDSGVYNAAGTTFDYRRIDDAIDTSDENVEGVTEWITATGPIREAIHLMILIQGKNPGIKLEYLLPVNAPAKHTNSEEINRSVEMEADMPPNNSADADTATKLNESKSRVEKENIERRKRKHAYVWRVVSFSSCSKPCGGGTLTPIIRCVRENNTAKFYAHKRCAHQAKPTLNENVLKCNTQPCPAYWKIDEWSACNCGLPNERDHQSREIKCVQELGSGIVIQIHEGACTEKKPETRQDCDCPKKQVGHYHNNHKRNHRERSHHPAAITLIGNSTIGKRVHKMHENKKAGVWLSSEWNNQCSTKCGEGIQYRSIFCDRSAPKTERCDIRLTPDITRSCTEMDRCNVGDWFLGPWSECFGDCFNLMRSRSVLCIKEDQIVGDTLCIDPNNENTTKPATIEKCQLGDVSYCKPKWHYSEWTECSKSCGSGTQRRTVKCFEPDLKETLMKESDNCRYSERSQAFRSCNTHACDGDVESLPEQTTEHITTTTKKHVEPKVRLIQNDSTPKCVDQYPNCHVVVKARLCTYDYYIENCCETCKEAIALGY